MTERERLSRGKTTPKKGNCEFDDVWVCGDLIHSGDKYYIHPKSNLVRTEGELGKLIIMHEVIPETVSQYTGLTDKNDKKIFEGDIVKVKHSYHPYEEISTNHCPRRAYGCHWTDFDRLLNYYRNYAVEWKEQGAQFILRNGSDQHRLSRNYISFHGAEVIGNIHDNPELLKGGAKCTQ